MSTDTYPNLSELFKQWWGLILNSRYQHWKEIRDEEKSERDYAEANDMESCYWCQKCTLGICEDYSHN